MSQSNTQPTAQPAALPARADLPAALKWRLEDIYPSDDLWAADADTLARQIPEIETLSGTLGGSEAHLLSALQRITQAEHIVSRLYTYAHMRRDEDNANPVYQRLTDRAQKYAVDLESATSFLTPELLELDEPSLRASLEKPEFADYRRQIESVLRQRPHTLPAPQERLLAAAGEMAAGPDTIFTMLSDVDLDFGHVEKDGQPVKLTHGSYLPLMESPDRAVRVAAFQGVYSAYKSHLNTLAAVYVSSVRKDIFFSRARNYKSSLEATLSPSEIPLAVYDSLIEAVHAHLPAMHRYMRLRKKALRLDELHMYDIYTPIVAPYELAVPYEKAAEIVEAGLAPLGDRYLADMKTAWDGGWIDVHETQGKTSGAYSWGVYGVHPYVLLNYQQTLDSLFTLAHEMGHAMHSFYSNGHQPLTNANYPLFLAEVASIVNEELLMAHLLTVHTDKKAQRYLLNTQLEQFRLTMYRQTMFAEFERWVYEKEESGEPLTADQLCAAYKALNERYYGTDMVTDEEISWEWSRIPHFYRAFYVYQYATGHSAAVALSRRILSGGDAEREAYLGFLASGNSRPPLDTLKAAGVDLTQPSAVNACLEAFEETLQKLEALGVEGE